MDLEKPMFRSLKDRLPPTQQIFAVYGISALLIHGWTLMWLFWKLPSWEYFLNFGEISAAFAYAMAVNLLECLFILFVLLFFCMVLPHRWFRDVFVSRAGLLEILGLGYVMFIALNIPYNSDTYPANLVRMIPVFVLLILGLVFFVGRIALVQKLVENLADRAAIFAYIFGLLGFVSLLVVIVRNIV
jgi:hypothetical protein